jgi:hypothetical protein
MAEYDFYAVAMGREAGNAMTREYGPAGAK